MMQLVARIPDEIAAQVDELVSSGLFESRSHAVREALAQLIDRRKRAETGRQIVEGYLRMPQTDDEVGWTDSATRAMIEEEPW